MSLFDPMPGDLISAAKFFGLESRRIALMDTKLSQETIDALKAIDDNIRNAHLRAGSILVGDDVGA